MPRQTPPRDHVNHQVAALIRERRLGRGLTQDDLAQLIDCSLRAVRAYEQGSRMPDVWQLLRIARACDLPLSIFLAPLDNVELDDPR